MYSEKVKKANVFPLSHSKLTTAECPSMYYQMYVKEGRFRGIDSPAAAIGSATHLLLEDLSKLMADHLRKQVEAGEPFPNLATLVVSRRDVEKMAAAAVRRHLVAFGGKQEDVDDLGMGEIVDMGMAYLRKPPPIMNPDVLLEREYAVKDNNGVLEECRYDDPEAFYRGKIDLLSFVETDEGRVPIMIDHKTSLSVKQVGDTRQMGGYALLLAVINPGVHEIRTGIHMSRWGKYTDLEPWNRYDIEKVESHIRTAAAVLVDIAENEAWHVTVPQETRCTYYCPFLKTCPAGRAAFTEAGPDGGLVPKVNVFSTMRDNNLAVAYMNEVVVLEARLEALKDAVKEHVKACGTVFSQAPDGKTYEVKVGKVAVGDKVYGFHPTLKRKWEALNGPKNEVRRLKFEERLRSQGWDPDKFKGYSQSMSKGLFAANNPNHVVAAAAEEAVPYKLSQSWGAKSIERDGDWGLGGSEDESSDEE